MRRKGFTLIELIVVMAIISILVLFGMPKYKNYVNEARVTRYIVEAKEIEKASQQYYIRHNNWPRLSDIPYTKEQVKGFGEKIYDKTGVVIELDELGNYYDINYAALTNYITNVESKLNYILQNPIGNVYIIDKVTEAGRNRIEVPEEPELPVEGVLGMNGYKIPEGSTFYASSLNSTHPTYTADKVGDGTSTSLGYPWTAGNNNSYVDIVFPNSQAISGVEVYVGSFYYAGNGTVTIQNYINDAWQTVTTKTMYVSNTVNIIFNIPFTETTFNKMRVNIKASNSSWIGCREITLIP